MSDPSLTTFSPAESLVGGIFIGLSVVARLLALGTVTGISGIYGASVRLESLEKVAFSIGIFLSGVALFWGYPPPFTRVPDDLPVYRPVVAAVLVAVGTHLGNGCTSGHGICGISRLSLRSIVAVPLFMATGFLVASLSKSASDFGVRDVAYSPASPAFAGGAAALISCAVCSCALALILFFLKNSASDTPAPHAPPSAPQPVTSVSIDYVAAEKQEQATVARAPSTFTKHQALLFALEFVSGFLFGSGLVVAGMVNPSKVTAFLSALPAVFDPSLAFVMGGAIAVAFPAFQYIIRREVPCDNKSMCGRSYDFPKKTVIDARLLLGSALFGCGWGLCGVCPGPALVSLARGESWILIFMGVYTAFAITIAPLEKRLLAALDSK